MTAPLVVVGASWGGMHAVSRLLEGIDGRAGLTLVVALHRAVDNDETLEEVLQRHTTMPVVQVDDKQSIVPGHVFVAPPDYHLFVDGSHFSLSTEDVIRFSRPSIDALFETAADSHGQHVVAVVLTGANDDGCRGVLAVKAAGGRTIAQDPATAERPEMPAGAIASGAVDLVLPVEGIAGELNRLGGVA